jgi:ABC-type transporter Mla maintaining outer membrane lipid asymmetry ATPase subunit MlaF
MAEPTEAVEGAEPILRVRGIGRRFGSAEVEEADLEVPRARRSATLGPSGR